MKPNQPNAWRPTPLFKIFICFALGICCQHLLDVWHWSLFTACLGIGLGSLGLQFVKTKFKHQYQLLLSCSLYILFFLVGIIHNYWSQDRHQVVYFNQFEYDQLSIDWGAETKENDRWYKSVGRVTAVQVDTQWIACQGNVLVYLDKALDRPTYGEQLVVQAKCKQIEGPKIPGKFDYRRYMANKGVHHQLFVRPDYVKRTGILKQHPIIHYALDLRHWLQDYIEELFVNANSRAMVSALLLGDRSELDHELVQKYANIGVVHVLAVSGLHVGGLYLLLVTLLKGIGFRSNRLVSFILIIGVLWAYAFITGMSASVCRASLMFTLYGIGRLISRKVNVLNIWAAAGFVLLALNPLQLFDIGFQLSFLAVLGIVSLYKPAYHLWEPRTRIGRKVWSLMVVSTSAQLITFPIVLYYFHQVSLIFLISNLIIVPLITVLFYGGIAALLLGGIPWLANYLVLGLDNLVHLLLELSSWFNGIPFAYLDGIYISEVKVFCIFGLVAMASFALAKRLKYSHAWIGAMSFAVLFWMADSKDKKTCKSSSEVVLIGNEIVIRDGIDVLSLSGGDTLSKEVQEYLATLGVKDYRLRNVSMESNTGKAIISGFRVAFVSSNRTMPKADIAVVQNLTDVSWEQLVESYNTIYISDQVEPKKRYAYVNWVKRRTELNDKPPKIHNAFYNQSLVR